MSVFNVIALFGGLAMFLYGMRLMGDSLKEGSSGTLKLALEKVTNNRFKAFLLGLLITAVIQSSTATIVITSGLVAAGIISLDQSLGIIVGANVGTTVTGQIIRLLDLNAGANSILKFFQPSTLAPIALILGIALIMFFKFDKSDNIGKIAIGFGILFSGLLNMTQAVGVLTDSGAFDSLFTNLSDNPFFGYLTGAGVAFILQSSSATIGILQAFSQAGDIPFRAIYAVLVGIYLGDCVTTAIVCSIGANAEAKRVGIVNILFNLSETLIVLVSVTILHQAGALDGLWNMVVRSGDIANTNTIFNLGCSILLLPIITVYAKASRKIVKTVPSAKDRYTEKLAALNPVFFKTPALAFRSCYEALIAMFTAAYINIGKALTLVYRYDKNIYKEIAEEEENIDMMTDKIDSYLVDLSPHVSEELHKSILNQYHRVVTEFEHLGDCAMHIADAATALHTEGIVFSQEALGELEATKELLDQTLMYTDDAFRNRDVEAARHIEPLEEVMDDMVNTLHDNHLARLHDGKCSIRAGVIFLDILTNLGRVSDTCSNIGLSTIARVEPQAASLAHTYISSLHSGRDANYNKEYHTAHDLYFSKLTEAESRESQEMLVKDELGIDNLVLPGEDEE